MRVWGRGGGNLFGCGNKKNCSTNMMKQLKLHVNINLEVFENLRMYLRVSI